MAVNTDKELRNQVMYQIFVRNFSEEGTFLSVIPRLPLIRALGVDIIYLTPIHPIGKACRKGTLGSPYAISDYRSVNPEFGSLEDLEELVSEIHANGMKCIIDVVYNHTSPDSRLAIEHPEWFYHDDDGNIQTRVSDWSDVVDLDYSHMELWDYQIETLKMWAGIIDGFRCDVASLVPVEFWIKARSAVSEVRLGAIWLCESVHPAFITYMRSRGFTAHSDCELYQAFDIGYDYDIFEGFQDYFASHSAVALEKYASAVNRQEYTYPDNYVKLRFLENHDQSRARSYIEEPSVLRNATAFLFFQKGMAFLYAGQEYGLSHLPSLFDKDTIEWSAPGKYDLSALIARLSEIKKLPIFADSLYMVNAIGSDIIFAMHQKENEKIIGFFSFSGKSCHIDVNTLSKDRAGAAVLSEDGTFTNMIDGSMVKMSKGVMEYDGEPVIFSL